MRSLVQVVHGKARKVLETGLFGWICAGVVTLLVVVGFASAASVNVFSSLEGEAGTRSGNVALVPTTAGSANFAVKFGTTGATAALCDGMELWSQAATWNGAGVPIADANATIPAGKQVKVDVDVPHLTSITVPTGTTLCFPDRATTFSATRIVVNGKLQAGTATKRLTSNVTFKLEGGNPADTFLPTGAAATAIANYQAANGGLCAAGDGCINVGQGNIGTNFMTAFNGGQIEMYGQEKGRMWTDLASTSNAGSSTLVLRDAVSWQAGDIITIASSAFDWKQEERRTVQSVSGDGKTVTLTAPLTYKHASVQTCEALGGETRCIDERAEVGLLSQNIKITGPSDAASTQFSGHVGAWPGGRINVANAEFYNLGQKAKLGRYPLHFHILGNGGSDSSVSNISLHDNYNRQIDMHGTNNVQVSGVVASRTIGHGIMFEDGLEQNNTLTNNLVLGSTRNPTSAERLRVSENTPSNYWLAHPNNNLTGNHSGGSDGSGIWYDLGPTRNFNGWAAITADWGTFDDNVSHSNWSPIGTPGNAVAGDQGNGIFVDLYQHGTVQKPVYRNSAWKNQSYNFWIDGNVTFVDSSGANSCFSVTMENSYMRGGIQAMETANSAGDAGYDSFPGVGCGALRQYHGGSDFDDIWITNFGGTAKTAWMSGVSDEAVGIADRTSKIRNIKFFGPGYKVFYEACKYMTTGSPEYWPCYEGEQTGSGSHVLYDLDGSIRGDGQPIAITSSTAFMRYGQNFLYKDISPYPSWGTASRGLITPAEYKYMSLVPNYRNGVKLVRESDGATHDEDSWTMLRLGDRYTMSGVTDPSGVTQWVIQSAYTGYVDLVIDYAQQPQAVQRAPMVGFGPMTNQPKASSLANLGVDGNWWWSGGKLYVRCEFGGVDVPFGKQGERNKYITGDDIDWKVVP